MKTSVINKYLIGNQRECFQFNFEKYTEVYRGLFLNEKMKNIP